MSFSNIYKRQETLVSFCMRKKPRINASFFLERNVSNVIYFNKTTYLLFLIRWDWKCSKIFMYVLFRMITFLSRLSSSLKYKAKPCEKCALPPLHSRVLFLHRFRALAADISCNSGRCSIDFIRYAELVLQELCRNTNTEKQTIRIFLFIASQNHVSTEPQLV